MNIDDEASFIEDLSRPEVGMWRDMVSGISHALHPSVAPGSLLVVGGPWSWEGEAVMRLGAPAHADLKIHHVEPKGGRTYLLLEDASPWDPDTGTVPPMVFVEAVAGRRVRALSAEELANLLEKPRVALVKRKIMPPSDWQPGLEAAVHDLYGDLAPWATTRAFWEQTLGRALVLQDVEVRPAEPVTVNSVHRVSPPLVWLAPKHLRPSAPVPRDDNPESIRGPIQDWFSVERVVCVGGRFYGVLSPRDAAATVAPGGRGSRTSLVRIDSTWRWSTPDAEGLSAAAPVAAAAMLARGSVSAGAFAELLGLVSTGEPRARGVLSIAMRTRRQGGHMLRGALRYEGVAVALQGDYWLRALFRVGDALYAIIVPSPGGSEEDEYPPRLLCRVKDGDTLELVEDIAFRKVAAEAHATLLASRRVDESLLGDALGRFPAESH